uniref:Uncharacterized protein n=1 Tax=Rhizophora mucronata TaxID=61149 RepID=A0A2P2Q3Q9_RHIMU
MIFSLLFPQISAFHVSLTHFNQAEVTETWNFTVDTAYKAMSYLLKTLA